MDQEVKKGIVGTFFDKKIKPVLMYVGTIGAVLSAIAYIIIIITMIFGLTVEASIKDTVIFACVNAVIGFVIMQFLKIQGITFAKNIPENQDILKQWRDLNPNKGNKKKHSLKYFWVSSVVKDVLTRALLIVITTICIIYLVIKGTHDYTYLLLMVVNLLMFACFGLISLVNANDFYIEQHIPYIQEQINVRLREHEEIQEGKQREVNSKAEIKEDVDMVKEEYSCERNDMVCPNCRTGILESSDSVWYTCNNCGQVVLVRGSELYSVLGSTVHTRLDDTDCSDVRAEESSRENKIQKVEQIDGE